MMTKSTGIRRSVRLVRLFRVEQTDPDAFYGAIAQDAVAQLSAYGDLAGHTVVDVGGGGGYYTAAFRAAGAHCYLFEPDLSELHSTGAAPPGAVVADGYWLPVRDGGADVTFSSNVLEHVADPVALIEEMIRATRPGGLVYVSYTNWFSPWGGHEMSPWHYLGAGYAERRYCRKYGRKPKNLYGTVLYQVHIGPLVRALKGRSDIEILAARPRYYPRWCGWITRVPGLREFATWNLMLIMRRR